MTRPLLLQKGAVRYVWLRFNLLLFFFLLFTANCIAQTYTVNLCNTLTDPDNSNNKYEICLTTIAYASGRSTWTYTYKTISGTDISHVVFSAADCAKQSDDFDGPGTTGCGQTGFSGNKIEVVNDAFTGITGIKFDCGTDKNSQDPNLQTRTVTFTINGLFSIGKIDFGIKAGTDGDAYTSGIAGPNCSITMNTNNKDFGDLPDSYKTLAASGGPSHLIATNIRMGANIDVNTDGSPTASANGDDNNSTDDEDGISSFPTFTAGQTATITVNLTNTTGNPARLYGFIDWNNDGDFNDVNEAPTAVTVANNAATAMITFNVPFGAVTGSNLGARFRLTTNDLGTGGTAASGAASNGEVEDYTVIALSNSSDCGDAFSWMQNYSLIAFGDLNQMNEGEGSVFVGGNLNLNNTFQIGINLTTANYGNSGARKSLEVAGGVIASNSNITMLNYSAAFASAVNYSGGSQGTVQTIGGGTRTVSLNNNLVLSNVSIMQDLDLPNKAAKMEADLQLASNQLCATASTNNYVFDFSTQNASLTISSDNPVIINLTEAQTTTLFSTLTSFNLTVPGNVANFVSPIIINLKGNSITANGSFKLENIPSDLQDNLIWNFCNTTSLSIPGVVKGSFLAPFANVTLGNNIDGVLVAQNVSIASESHLPFVSTNFSPQCTPLVCDPPTPFSQCTPPTLGYNRDIIVSSDVTWESVLAEISPDNVTQKIRITGSGNATVRVNGKDLTVKSTGLLVIDGVQLIVDNGGLKLDESGAIVIIRNGSELRTTKDITQVAGTYLCITDTEIEVGDEIAGGYFNTAAGGGQTIANFQNAGNRYLEDVCMNVTQDFQNQGGGVDILINVCSEIGDRGPTNASANLNEGMSRDGNDTGNFQNDGTMSIYNSTFTLPNGNVKNESSKTMTVCNTHFRVDNGNFQNDGTLKGEDVCIWSFNTNGGLIDNNGTWTATFDKRKAETVEGSFGVTVPSNSSIANIQTCFISCCGFGSCAPPSIGDCETPAITFTGFTGAGFSPNPSAGQLCSGAWVVTGLSEGNGTLGGTHTSGDFARGNSGTPGVGTGGIYAVNNGGNPALWLQPTDDDLTPGTITTVLCNNSGATMTDLVIGYDILSYNNEGRANSFNFSYAKGSVGTIPGSFTAVSALDYTSPEAASGSPSIQTIPRQTVLTGINLAAGQCIYLRWTTNDVSGSGSRDEFGLDNIFVAPPSGCYALGNRVFLDYGGAAPNPSSANYNNGLLDVGEFGKNGVGVTLRIDPNGDGDLSDAQLVGTDITANNGYFIFTQLLPTFGNRRYVISVNASNFASGGALEGLISSTLASTDLTTDNNDNGANTLNPTYGISTGVISLTGTQPTTETDKEPGVLDGGVPNNKSNLTLDLGFYAATANPLCATTGNQYLLDFDADDEGMPLNAGNGTPGSGTQIGSTSPGIQPYADLFGAGMGVTFASGTSKILALYNSELTNGDDPDLERNDAGNGNWAFGNLGNINVGNLLIINEDNDVDDPNDSGTGGSILSTSIMLLQEFAFDLIDLEGVGNDDVLIFQNTFTGETKTVKFSDFLPGSGTVFATAGVAYGDRSGNRITGITAQKLGISAFNKITFDTDDSFGIGSICIKKARTDFGDFLIAPPATEWPQATAILGPDSDNNGKPESDPRNASNPAVWAGTIVDAENSQQESADALGDDNSLTSNASGSKDDEDGLTLPNPNGGIIRGQSYDYFVEINSSGATVRYFKLFFDWDNDGDFEDVKSGSQASATGPVTSNVVVTIPNNAVSAYKVRLIVSSDPFPVSPMDGSGTFPNAEVEDYTATTITPIELLDFTATATKDQHVLLKWRTASEKNNAYFSIQRSRDGIKWHEIGQQKGAGNSQTVRAYDYLDVQPLPGVNYYRLQQFDFDGASSFSPIEVVIFEGKAGQALLYPNPTSHMLYLEMTDNAEYEIEVFNITGQRVNVGVSKISTDVIHQINTSDLAPGTYFIRIADPSGANLQLLRFIRQ